MDILDAIRKFALSKEGIPFLIFLLICGAFATGYNYYALRDAFSQVKTNKQMITKVSEVAQTNKNNLDKARRKAESLEKRDREIRRNLRIIGCSLDLTHTARQFLRCEQLDLSKNKTRAR